MINLFESTDRSFTTLGVGTLHPAKCEITHNIAGTWELLMEIPAEDKYAKAIRPQMILYATVDDKGHREPFEVVKIAPASGNKITVTAWHVFYQLQWLIVAPFTAANLGDALDGLRNNLVLTQSSEFTLATDLSASTAGNFVVKIPSPLKTLLQGAEGSIVQTYGGEWDYTGWTARLKQRIGAETEVIVRTGKNLLSYAIKMDSSKQWTGVVAYYHTDEATVWGNVITVPGTASQQRRPKVVDATEDFDSVPTDYQLNTWAMSYAQRNGSADIRQTVKFSMAALWQTDEYKSLAALEQLSLGDSFRLVIPEYEIDEETRLVETVYDERTNRYKALTAGTIERNFVQQVYQGIRKSGG